MRLPMIAALPAAAPLFANAAPLENQALEDAARRIHEDVLTLDTHVDISIEYATAALDPGGFTTAQVDLPKMRAGGRDAAFFIVYTPQTKNDADNLSAAEEIAETRLSAIERFAGGYPAEIGLATSADEVRAIAATGRRVALIGMENAYPLGQDLSLVDGLAARGVRYVGITHFGHNQFGDSSNDNADAGVPATKWNGLSPLGRELVAKLNRVGILGDVSHAAMSTMMQAVKLSKTPIIASHSGAKAIGDVARNLDDEQLRALAANGGVVQIVALDGYLKPFTDEQVAFRDALRKEMDLDTSAKRGAADAATLEAYAERLDGTWEIEPRATVADFVDHIDHAVQVAGIDHVGIASDFDGGGGVDGWEDASETLNVTRELVWRGYGEAEIAKIWGGNLLRVLEAVERAAGPAR
ncbi:MAG: dipeptidase [Parvularculaceae bacterium]